MRAQKQIVESGDLKSIDGVVQIATQKYLDIHGLGISKV